MQLICQTYFLSAEKYFAITEGADNISPKNRVLSKDFIFFFFLKKAESLKQSAMATPILPTLLLVELQIKVWEQALNAGQPAVSY